MPSDETPLTSDATLANPDTVVEFDPADETSLTTTIVEVVSQLRGVECRELDPLYRTVDPDAITTLFHSMSPSDGGRLQFTYSGCTVAIHPHGLMKVCSGGGPDETND